MAYNAESIQIKDFRTACRSTPGMYIGTDGQDAAFNCFLEVLNNACDEAIMGRGKEIEVALSADHNTISVTDHGAGVPHGRNKDTDEVLIELFTTAHSSGKFDNSNYRKVRGCHGIGTSAVCVCSTFFEVVSRRDGAEYSLVFKDGVPQTKAAQKVKATKVTGSTFTFTPDRKIFNIEGESFSVERLREELELTSFFIPKVTFTLTYDDKTERFYSLNGLKDFAAKKVVKPLNKSYIYGYKTFDDDVEVEVFAQWTGGKGASYIFSNGALNVDGGTPDTGAKAAFTKTVNTLGKGSYEADSIRKGLVYIVNIRHPHPIYQNQTKTKIQNAELRTYTQSVFSEAIKAFAKDHSSEFEEILNLLEREAKANAAAEKAREAILNHEREMTKRASQRIANSEKLRDARELGQDSTLLICEGLSAAGSLSTGRAKAKDGKKFGILGLRGKAINCLTATTEEILNNEEMQLLMQALGVTYGKLYKADNLRYGRIAIATDADFDGSHIGLLVIAALQQICPQFLKESRLSWLIPPLYKIGNHFYYSEEEFAQRTEKGEAVFYKGLGQMSEADLTASMFDETNRKMLPIEFSEEGCEELKALMGKEVEPRKKFVLNIDFGGLEE